MLYVLLRKRERVSNDNLKKGCRKFEFTGLQIEYKVNLVGGEKQQISTLKGCICKGMASCKCTGAVTPWCKSGSVKEPIWERKLLIIKNKISVINQ